MLAWWCLYIYVFVCIFSFFFSSLVYSLPWKTPLWSQHILFPLFLSLCIKSPHITTLFSPPPLISYTTASPDFLHYNIYDLTLSHLSPSPHLTSSYFVYISLPSSSTTSSHLSPHHFTSYFTHLPLTPISLAHLFTFNSSTFTSLCLHLRSGWQEAEGASCVRQVKASEAKQRTDHPATASPQSRFFTSLCKPSLTLSPKTPAGNTNSVLPFTQRRRKYWSEGWKWRCTHTSLLGVRNNKE